MLGLFAKYKLYAVAAAGVLAVLLTAVTAAYVLGKAHGVSKCERAVNAEKLKSYEHVIEQVEGWAKEDAADRIRWDAENKKQDTETDAKISLVLRKLGDLANAEPVTLESTCADASLSYRAVELRNEASAATGYRARDDVEASTYGFDLAVPAPSTPADTRE